jgi:predicted RNA-binding protein YlqC (UPF0109 family)
MSLARGLVDRPDQIELRSQPADGGTLFELKVAPRTWARSSAATAAP